MEGVPRASGLQTLERDFLVRGAYASYLPQPQSL